MPDSLNGVIEPMVGRAASRATGIGAAPDQGLMRLAELIFGIPLDPSWYHNASREDIFMNLVPQAATRGLTRGRAAGRAIEGVTGIERWDMGHAMKGVGQSVDNWLASLSEQLTLRQRLKDLERYTRTQ
jgi:hypothetical protein